MPRAISSSVKPWNLPVKLLLLRPLSAYLKSVACLTASAPTTVFLSLRPTLCSTSPSSRSGGCAWASPSNASSPVIPSKNGRHERMHLTLKTETTRPAGMHSLQQQSKFDDFLEEFNNERPHEALDMKCPAEVYTPALRRYRGLPELAYPFHDQTIHVTNCGPYLSAPQKN